MQTNEEEVQHLLLLASVCSVMIISKLKFGPIEKSVIALNPRRLVTHAKLMCNYKQEHTGTSQFSTVVTVILAT